MEDYVQKHLGNVVVPVAGKNVHLTLQITRDDVVRGGSIESIVGSVMFRGVFAKGGQHSSVCSVCFLPQILVWPAAAHADSVETESNVLLQKRANVCILALVFFSPIHSYIVPNSSAVSLVFSISEEDDTDRALMQVFLLEFAEAKRTVPGCPAVMFSRDAPVDINGLVTGAKPSVGYLLFCTLAWDNQERIRIAHF